MCSTSNATLDDVFLTVDPSSFEDATTVGAMVFSFGFEISTPVGAGGNCWESTCVTEVGLDTRDTGFLHYCEDALFGDVSDVGEPFSLS